MELDFVHPPAADEASPARPARAPVGAARIGLLALSLLAAALAAHGAGTLTRGPATPRAPEPGPADLSPEPRPPRDPERILSSGLFAPSPAAPPAAPPASPPDASCPTDLRLVATVGGARPLAVLAPARGPSAVHSVGDRLGEHALVAVSERSVWLAGPGGEPCELEMRSAADHARERRRARVAARPPPSAASTAAPPSAADGIEHLGGTRYRVPRALVLSTMTHPRETLHRVGVSFPEDRGRVLGAQIRGVRPGSLLARLGLEDGDVLRSANGFPLTGLDGALEAMGGLGTARRLTLSVMRRGRVVSLDYALY